MNIIREMSGKCQGILKKPVAMNLDKQYVIAAIETHILVNFFNKTVFGDYVFLPKIKMVSSI